jgi:large subunit ribosomal protein L23
MRRAEDIIIRPYVTEKSTGDVVEYGKYTFIVHVDASKAEIRLAVEQLFGVKVLKVNTANHQGKMKRMGVHQGRRSKWKKAIVKIDLDPNGTKTKKGKEYQSNSFYDKDGKLHKDDKKYKTSIEEFGIAQ